MTPDGYIDGLEAPRRDDVRRLDELIRESMPGRERTLANGMLAYGPYRYRYATGREGDTSLVALASQKRYISLYVMCSADGQYLAERYAPRLPKASVGKSCIRFKRADDVDLGVLREMLTEADRIGPASEKKT